MATPSKAAKPNVESNPPPSVTEGEKLMNMNPSVAGSPRKEVPIEKLPNPTLNAQAFPPHTTKEPALNKYIPEQAAEVNQPKHLTRALIRRHSKPLTSIIDR